jgi:membrane protease subunit HflK
MRYLVILVLALVGLSLLTAVTQVQSGERAVVRRFGRILENKPGPGLFIGLPWGMDRVDRVQVERVRRVTVGFDPAGTDDEGLTPPGQMVTGDHNLIDIRVEIYYRVRENEVERFVLQADRAEGLLGRAAEAVLVEWVAGQSVDSLVSGERQALQEHVRDQTQDRIDQYDLGLEVQQATITYVAPPRQVKDAFAAVAQEETKQETAINIAHQEANSRLQTAASEADHLRRQAGAYALEQRLRAQGEAATFLKRMQQYQRLRKENPSYLSGLWWDETARLFSTLRDKGRIDLLDNHLGPDGLDITQMPGLPRKK